LEVWHTHGGGDEKRTKEEAPRQNGVTAPENKNSHTLY
jgi:hypothetical protein